MKNLSADEQKIREITSFYSLRNLVVVVGTLTSGSFTLGVMITKMKGELIRNSERISHQETETMDRVKEWGNWRANTTFKLDETRWMVDDHEDRIKTLEK